MPVYQPIKETKMPVYQPIRETKELLELVLQNIYKLKKTDGLCGLINDLGVEGLILMDEAWILWRYIHKNRPVNNYYFLNKINGNNKYLFYWKSGEKEPRIQWLKKHINKLK